MYSINICIITINKKNRCGRQHSTIEGPLARNLLRGIFISHIVLHHGDVKYTLSGRPWGKPDVKGASRIL
nr:MAG TPA: hypothetical protein [Caudoviricetes sp.]